MALPIDPEIIDRIARMVAFDEVPASTRARLATFASQLNGQPLSTVHAAIAQRVARLHGIRPQARLLSLVVNRG